MISPKHAALNSSLIELTRAFVVCLYSLLRVEPAQRMAVTELLEHQWLNEGVVPDVPLDSPSIIVADEVCPSLTVFLFSASLKGLFRGIILLFFPASSFYEL